MSSSQKAREYFTTLLDIEDDDFNSKMKTTEIHEYLFLELSISPISIYQIIESFLIEYQPSIENTSYYIHHELRFRLFLILSHLLNNNNNSIDSNYSNQVQKLRDISAQKLKALIFDKVFPCKSGIYYIYIKLSLRLKSIL